MAAEIERRVFVVGVPRSGTTLVQSLLAAHSTTASFTESHFFSRHFAHVPGFRRPILVRSPAPRLREFLAENDETPPEASAWIEAKLGARALLPFRTREAARGLLRVLDELTLRRGKSSWVEKTPRHLRYVPFLAEIEPGARFVHVIRDGLDVVASLRRASLQWERPYDVDECVRRWNRDVRSSLDRVDADTDRFVFYEELTAEPEAVLASVVTGLGLGWEPEILDRYADVSDGLVTRAEGWKDDVGRTIQPSSTSEQALTDGERRRALQLLDRDLYDRLKAASRRRS